MHFSIAFCHSVKQRIRQAGFGRDGYRYCIKALDLG